MLCGFEPLVLVEGKRKATPFSPNHSSKSYARELVRHSPDAQPPSSAKCQQVPSTSVKNFLVSGPRPCSTQKWFRDLEATTLATVMGMEAPRQCMQGQGYKLGCSKSVLSFTPHAMCPCGIPQLTDSSGILPGF